METMKMHNSVFDWLDRQAGFILPTLARFTFAAVLLMYFWGSAMTKLGDGIFGLFSPSVGAYAQIFPQKAITAHHLKSVREAKRLSCASGVRPTPDRHLRNRDRQGC